MFSIVCVFNDADVLRNRLLSSLAPQDQPHEVITVDNVAARFDRAATALNWGAARAHGDWLIFAHQDIKFLSSEWLARAEVLLESSTSRGWHGVAGLTKSGTLRGIMLDRAMLLGAPFEGLLEVQTLDECLLVHRRDAVSDQYFDEEVPGWHAYGVEACCTAIRRGAANYVLPLPLWHDSKSTNLQGLEEAHKYVWQKHGSALGHITTTCGDLPGSYAWAEEPRTKPIKRLWERVQNSYNYRIRGYPGTTSDDFETQLESLTESEDVIECLHAPAWYDRIEARGFVQFPRRDRRILHSFNGWDLKGLQSDCVVVAADLSNSIDDDFEMLSDLRQRLRRLLICADWQRSASSRKGLRELAKRARVAKWTKLWDGTARAVLEF